MTARQLLTVMCWAMPRALPAVLTIYAWAFLATVLHGAN